MDENTTAAFVASALALLKDRLDRMAEDTTRDEYYTKRIEQAVERLKRVGVEVRDTVEDLMLVVDYAAWLHANRDKLTGDPEWLRRSIRERWVNQNAT